MKKTIFSALVLSTLMVNAQRTEHYGRMGLNTTTPNASWEVARHTDLPETSPQGVLFPKLSTAQRDKFVLEQSKHEGMMIYNTNKKCIDWWNGSQWSCTDGTQIDYPLINTTPDQSVKAEVWDRTHYIASFNHNGFNTDGTLENTGINFITLNIPYNQATVNKNYNEINVVRTVKDRSGANKTITLHIPAGRFTTDKGFLNATIKIGNGTTDTYKVKQLAANTEEEITNFTFSINGRTSTIKLIASGGLLDRNWDKQTDGAYKHKFVYMPISAPAIESTIPTTGKPYEHTWLNNNLGAEYAKIGSASFNPLQQTTSHSDYKAYGSLFQWQRPADGHELITWTNATTGTLSGTTTTLSNNANWTAGHSNFISNTNRSWVNDSIDRDTSKHNLWQVNGANNPCPVGYHIPTYDEWNELHNALGAMRDYSHWANSILKLTISGYRDNGTPYIWYPDKYGNYWSSTSLGDNRDSSVYFNIDSQSSNLGLRGSRKRGRSVRCIKDE